MLLVKGPNMLDTELIPVGTATDLLAHDVLITTNYDNPTSANDRIHAKITNQGAEIFDGVIFAYRQEAGQSHPPSRDQHIILNPGQTVDFIQDFHGNQVLTEMWLEYNDMPLTRRIAYLPGYHYDGEGGQAREFTIGSNFATIRYGEWGTNVNWDYRLYSPPGNFLWSMDWHTDWFYCAYWCIEGLTPATQYEILCRGLYEDTIQFTTG